MKMQNTVGWVLSFVAGAVTTQVAGCPKTTSVSLASASPSGGDDGADASADANADADLSAPTANRAAYFGEFDQQPVATIDECEADQESPRCHTPDEFKNRQSTLLVFKAPQGQEDPFDEVNGLLCIKPDFKKSLKQICKERRQLELCEGDVVNSVLSRHTGLLIDKSPTCSGVALSGDHIATAAHCDLGGDSKHVHAYAVAGYVASQDANQTVCFNREQVYTLGVVDTTSAPGVRDYRIIRATPYDGHKTPLKPVTRCAGFPTEGTSLYSLGHPFGFEQFDSGVAEVVKSYAPNSHGMPVRAGLDLVESNSGSPVFDAETHCFVGIAPRRVAQLPRWAVDNACCGFVSVDANKSNSAHISPIRPEHYPHQ